MLADGHGELPVEFWLRCAGQLEPGAAITLWGGEPLLYAGFDALAEALSGSGHPLEVVTNATLADRHAGTLGRWIDRIHVSLDGPEELHDAVRGRGVFARVRRNLELLRERRGKLIFLCTVSDANVGRMAELPELLAELGPDEVILQQLMYLTGREIERYRTYSAAHFNCDYPELAAWRRDDDAQYISEFRRQCAMVAARSYPFKVRISEHAYPDALTGTALCLAPESRLHIRCDGEVGFCTDYFGFSIGNAKEKSLSELIDSPRAELWRLALREEALPVCSHCPWRRQLPYREADGN